MRRRLVAYLPVVAVVAVPLILPMAALPAAAATDPPLPEPVVHVVQETGLASERMNLTVLGDGYQWDQQRLFSDGLTNPLARGTTYGPAPLNCAAYTDYYPPGVDPCETGPQAHDRIIHTYVAPVLGIPRTSQNVQSLAIFNSFRSTGVAIGPISLMARTGRDPFTPSDKKGTLVTPLAGGRAARSK